MSWSAAQKGRLRSAARRTAGFGSSSSARSLGASADRRAPLSRSRAATRTVHASAASAAIAARASLGAPDAKAAVRRALRREEAPFLGNVGQPRTSSSRCAA
jgi:hypothetical protein